MAVSPAQLAANRSNAARSTGPRSPEGKARSAQNAIKHGLLSRHAVIQSGPLAEDQVEFDNHCASVRDAFTPMSSMEDLLCEQLAIAYWKLARLLRIESLTLASLDLDAADPSLALDPFLSSSDPFAPLPDLTVLSSPPDAADAPTGAALSNSAVLLSPLSRLARYEASIQRSIDRSISHLLHLQKLRRLGRLSADYSRIPQPADPPHDLPPLPATPPRRAISPEEQAYLDELEHEMARLSYLASCVKSGDTPIPGTDVPPKHIPHPNEANSLPWAEAHRWTDDPADDESGAARQPEQINPDRPAAASPSPRPNEPISPEKPANTSSTFASALQSDSHPSPISAF
jgi:hypothetical protein